MNTQLTRRTFIQSSTIAALTGLTLQKKARGQEDTQMQDFMCMSGRIPQNQQGDPCLPSGHEFW